MQTLLDAAAVLDGTIENPVERPRQSDVDSCTPSLRSDSPLSHTTSRRALFTNPDVGHRDWAATNKFLDTIPDASDEKENYSLLTKRISEFADRIISRMDFGVPAMPSTSGDRDQTDADRRFAAEDEMADRELSQWRLQRSGHSPWASNPATDDADSVRAHDGETSGPVLANFE